MLGLFRTNQFAANIFLLIYILIIRSAAIIFPQSWEPTGAGPFSDWVYYLLGASSGLIPDLIAALMVFIHAILLNELVARSRIANEITLYPGLFYALIASAIPEFLHLSPALMANTFFILAFYEVINTYKKLSAATQLFNLGLWISVASLFSFSYIALIIFGLIGVGLLRTFRLNERIMIILGGLVPFYLTGIYYFWMNSLPVYFRYFSGQVGMVSFTGPSNLIVYLELGFIGVLVLIAISSFGLYKQRKNIQVQKYISILFWALLFTAATLFFQKTTTIDHLMVITPPLAIMISLNFLSLGKKQIAEVFHLLLFFIVLIFQFLPTMMNLG